ncbi:allantoinase [Saccharopolyspora erythraea NRRL 2338]|uniref:allantoinase n=2 Tax=Saccharopolyspora erythraea TaxID=1836 RepID=A4FPB8_SACEN|nr:allantoinase AllB [Saccharopolyspora erythraea]EQD86691.1 allantoicase [Saccharopolyspora erythraea D]PFG99534.1 allantoinase [Saccharopolyspora erythraea NRRL 2338]QRK89435.1 allantoinase AllB [Saccharopolyspora erythraea]CAM05893.1 allantoinase [Saccharopolyspora erythraea NRRL 2338]
MAAPATGSPAFDVVFRARRLIGPNGEGSGAVGVRDGRIAAVESLDADLDAAEVVELADDEVLLPGLVDSHVHVNDPGRAEWEGFDTATMAAAEGGITTIVDMPLNSLPPTIDVDALEVKRKAARDRVFVDVGFWGGAVHGNRAELRGLHEAGVFGFKCFLLHSGVDEFPPLAPDELDAALRTLAEHDALMIVHAEDSDAIEHAPAPHGEAYSDFLASRPRGAENFAIAQVIELARRIGGRVHILHLSSSDALPMIASARADGVRVTVETCPHYLSFGAEEIPDGATQFKACPPIREARNRELLWKGLADGLIDCVVSDHSPCTPDLKRFDIGDFGVAWGGVSSLQLGLPAVWTQARVRGYGLADVVRWMARRPAEISGLKRKGSIAVGHDADFCVFAPDDAFVVDVAKLRHRNPVSPYHGRPLSGVVRGTWLRGKRIAGAGVDTAGAAQGRLLTRGEA